MSDRLLAAARLRLAENMEVFQANMEDLRQQMLMMNASMKVFDREMTGVARGISDLGDKSRKLSSIMDTASAAR
jgi:hypothetical protein